MRDWDNETMDQRVERAGRRAIEAISRVGTLNTDVAALNARVGELEALCGDLLALVETLIEGRAGA